MSDPYSEDAGLNLGTALAMLIVAIVALSFIWTTINSAISGTVAEPKPSYEAPEHLPNTCVDSDTKSDALAKFNLDSVHLERLPDGNLRVQIESFFISTRNGFGSSNAAISPSQGEGLRVSLILEDEEGQEDFTVLLIDGKGYRPEWAPQTYVANVTETESGLDLYFEGYGIQDKTKDQFRWAFGARDEANRWDLCPEQDHSINLESLMTYKE